MNTKMTYEVVENAETFERMLARVREAQKVFATYTQEQVDKIFRAAAMAANLQRIPLAKMAVALPPCISAEASPKAISRRTSYLRVRLEFLPYPHLIATLFNGCAFGPPLPFTAASTWTWIDHPVSGLHLLTLALLRLGFPTAPSLQDLTLPVCATRRTVLQKVRSPPLTVFHSL